MKGRPRILEYDSSSKTCAGCGSAFYFRDLSGVSFTKFLQRKFCSYKCTYQKLPIADRQAEFWEKVDVRSENECWDWQRGTGVNGYGDLKIGNKHFRSHRIAFELSCGPIPSGLMILHSCDNRKCCNPKHLRPGTAKENYQDAVNRNRLPHLKLKAVASPINGGGYFE